MTTRKIQILLLVVYLSATSLLQAQDSLATVYFYRPDKSAGSSPLLVLRVRKRDGSPFVAVGEKLASFALVGVLAFVGVLHQQTR